MHTWGATTMFHCIIINIIFVWVLSNTVDKQIWPSTILNTQKLSCSLVFPYTIQVLFESIELNKEQISHNNITSNSVYYWLLGNVFRVTLPCSIDMGQVSEYFALPQLLESMFEIVGSLFGIDIQVLFSVNAVYDHAAKSNASICKVI